MRPTVFEALADPTRRLILDRLRTGGMLSVNEVAEPLAITRQGTTKHLDVLVRSGLVRMQRHGRERLHVLDPEPLAEVQEWLAPYAEEWDRRLERLKRHVDGDSETSQDEPSGPETP